MATSKKKPAKKKRASRKAAAKKAKATRDSNFIKRVETEPLDNQAKMHEYRKRKKALQREIWG
jgi:hypothetical protein